MHHSVPHGLDQIEASLETIGKRLGEIDFSPLKRLPIPDFESRLTARELRILRKALFRRSLPLQRSTILWRILLALSPRRARLLYRAFILNDALTPAQWQQLIGSQQFEEWRDSSMFRQQEKGFSWDSRVIHTGHCALVMDDGRGGEQHAYCGTDSLVLLEFCLRRIKHLGRSSYLDVGVGTGPLLCGIAPYFSEAVGIDINPRAVRLTRLNVELNGLNNVRVEEADVFELSSRGVRYDVVTWNVPYLFVPQNNRRVCNDGGKLGIGLTVRFLGYVAELLNSGGRAFIMASSPLMKSGELPLHDAVKEIASDQQLDIKVIRQWDYSSKGREQFLLENGVESTEVVIIAVSKGAGRVRYISGVAARVREAVIRGGLL